MVNLLHVLELCGEGNPEPLFADKNIRVKQAYILGKNRNLLKLILETKEGISIEGICFGNIDEFEQHITDQFGIEQLDNMYLGKENNIKLDTAYLPSINEYKGRQTMQIIIKYFRLSYPLHDL